MPYLTTFAVLSWLGHLFALIAMLSYAWDGFLLGATVDLSLQAGLLNWIWVEGSRARANTSPPPAAAPSSRPEPGYTITWNPQHQNWDTD